MGRFVFLFVLFLLHEFEFCYASNILLISAVASHSHSIWCNELAELLVNRGHMVTILDTDPRRKNLANLTTYVLEGGYDNSGKVSYLELTHGGAIFAVDFLLKDSTVVSKNMMHSPTLKRFIKEHSHKKKPFDLIIHDVTASESFLGLVPTLGNPKLVLVTAFGEGQALNMMRNEGHSVQTPMYLSTLSHPMSFIEKLQNLYYNIYHNYRYRNYISIMDAHSKEIFGPQTPHVSEIGRSAAVALVNTHPVIDGARYYSPTIIQIPGFHIKDPMKLDAETQAFLDGSNDGAIFFSLGTNIRSAGMSIEIIESFLNVFGKLKQRVLWKLEKENMVNLPENVKISKWFSQNDILAHPNVKLFITHCGLLSTQEAIYHGVPMIGIPFWLDQHVINKKLSKKGLVFPLAYANLSEHTIREAIQEVLTNSSYRTEIERLSKIFKDRPVKPKDLAAFWIEHVLRNDDHKYLQPPETFLSTFELLFFDLKTILGILMGLITVSLFNSYSNRHTQQINKKKLKKSQ